MPAPTRRLGTLGISFVLLGLTLLLAACDRPFADLEPPLTLLEPDFSEVQTRNGVPIRVEAAPFLDTVLLNGTPMQRTPGTDVWQDTIQLARGLNTIVLEAEEQGRLARSDTFRTFFLSFRFTSEDAPPLLEPRGGHTTTQLSGDRLLVTGGAPHRGAPATATAYLFAPGDTAFVPLVEGLRTARAGHTASRLPDGRVLIVGGGTQPDPNATEALVETVELFDPATGRFAEIPTSGLPIRRAWHTAVVREADGQVLIDLYGGLGDVRYDPPVFGTRRDLRSFVFRNDSLVAVGAARGLPIEPLWGHVQVAPEAGVPRYWLAGTQMTANGSVPLGLTIDLGAAFVEDAPPLRTLRLRHAAARLAGGPIVVLGGTSATEEGVFTVPEVYVASAQRVFRFPATEPAPLPRYAHTATIRSPRRILLVGGFGPDGQGLTASEFLDVGL